MGLSISSLLTRFFPKEDIQIVMIGPCEAGKTSILYQLKFAEVISPIPTVGYNVETIEYKNLRFTIWDVSGKDTTHLLRRHYWLNCSAVIYVVDSSERERMAEAATELSKVLEGDELRNTKVLIFANKQDLPNALSTSEVADKMEMHTRKHEWYVQGTCARSGSGLYEGLDYLHKMLFKTN